MKKAAIVTGGAGGIGSEVCRRLAKDGWLVAVCYNSSEHSAHKLAKELTAEHYSAKAFYCDISSLDSIRKCVCAVRTHFGGIGLLVNNSGLSDINLFTDISDEKICKLIDINLIGAMRISREVLPEMLRDHSGTIINISSVWGECGASCEVAYSAAKAGIIGFTKALAKETAPSGIHVNCVSCGLIDTKMNSELSDEELREVIDDIPMCRMGSPKEVAETVAFLAGENSSYIQGQVIRVDGAWI